MSRLTYLLVALFALSFSLGTTGCKKKDPNKDGNKPTKTDGDHKDHDHKDGGHKDHDDKDGGNKGAQTGGDQEKIAANLAKLEAEDQKLAEAQKLCPVANKPLGSMGVPIKITIGEGEDAQVAFICCKGCEAKFNEDPDKYLAALKK